MTPYQHYLSYFENIANRHPEIVWFYELDEEEVINGLRSSVKYPCMFLETPDFGFHDNHTNTDSVVPSGIVILSACPQADIKRRKEILISHEQMIIDVVSYIREDDRKAQHHINTNELKYNKVGPVFSDNCYGWRLDIKYQKWVDLSFKQENWQEYNPDKFKK